METVKSAEKSGKTFTKLETVRNDNKLQFKVIINFGDGEITEHIFDNKNPAKMMAHNYNLIPNCVAKVITLGRKVKKITN